MGKTTLRVLSVLVWATAFGLVMLNQTGTVRDWLEIGPGGRTGAPYIRESFNSGALAGELRLFPAVADVSVSDGSWPTVADSELIVQHSEGAETRSFLKFKVAGIAGTVISARVLLRSAAVSRGVVALRPVASGWSAGTMSWSMQPVIDFDARPLAEVGPVIADTVYEWDVLPAVGGDGEYTFALTCDDCGAIYHARAGALAPYLAIVVAGGAAAGPGNPDDPVFAGAGDIGFCLAGAAGSAAEQTARLLDGIVAAAPGARIFTTGDNAYHSGAPAEFETCYDPTWGRHLRRTSPVPGNHDYDTAGAAGHFAYFGSRAGDPTKGYYSYDIGDWHVVALNSNCALIGGCGPGSPQDDWLRDDLARHRGRCVAAYLHHPPHSSGEHGGDPAVRPLMRTLHDFGAEILIAGHEHSYERFAPQDADGLPDLANGVRLFIVGTGGVTLRGFRTPVANSEARYNAGHGVLKLTLHAGSYDWEFVAVAAPGAESATPFTDTGSAPCH